jgi:hypothetical protein
MAAYEHEWRTGLFQWSSLPRYAMTAVCPCSAVYHLNRSHEWSAHHHDPMLSCCLASLSVCTVAPACVCVDQFATRTIDGALLAHRVSASTTNEPSFVSSLLTMAGYGEPEAHWAHDESGYDLQADDSENWWPLRMCGHYAWEWLRTACCECRGYGPHATRLPLWLACCAGAVYPITLCPMAFMLRRVIADRHRIHEAYHETCFITACCLPCSLVQMEVEEEAAASGAMLPTLASHYDDDNDDLF